MMQHANDDTTQQRPQWFDDLLAKYDPLIRKECRKRAGKIPFDDLYQESYLRLIRIWKQYRPGNDLGFCTWVSYTIRSVVRDHFRKKSPDVLFTDDVPDLVVAPVQEIAADVGQTMRWCKPRQREAMSLSVQGYDGREIGEMLGITRAAVSLRILSGRERLRKAANDNEPKKQAA